MCYVGPTRAPSFRLPAAYYFGAAKAKNRELKKLKSVSRSYRQSVVRSIKMEALRRYDRDQTQGDK